MNGIYVSLKDLVAECIRKIVNILICMLVFAVLLGTYGYSIGNTKTDELSDTKTLDERIKELSEEDYNKVMSYVRTVKQQRQELKYLDDSVIMQIDPYGVDTVNLQYIISDDDVADKLNIKKLLVNYISQGSLAQSVSNVYEELSEKEITDLIYCTKDNESVDKDVNLSSVVSVNIYGKDKEQVNGLEKAVKSCIDDYVEQTSIRDNVKLVSDLYHVAKSDELVLIKKKIISDSVSWNSTVSDSKTDIDDALKTLADEMLMQDGNNEELNNSKSDVSQQNSKDTKLAIKYGIIGLFVGALLSVFVIIVLYILNGTIKTNIDLKVQYGLYDFGNMSYRKSKKTEILADKYCYGSRLQKNYEDKSIMISNIVAVCKNVKIDNIILLGNVSEKNDNMVNELIHLLEQEKINVDYMGDILADATVANKIKRTDNVIFIETLRESRYEDVIREKNVCDKIKCNILGYVTIS